ncbi:MAG: three-Cys-motif partner protein TcmP [Planctomycetes bacterium]|nr:three-Cys-motif partner protein TcmP [Planctomycetota bacterium]MBL7188521.1 three-Cys-motif partner protein TcmP [Phycisphaerae bacterium]
MAVKFDEIGYWSEIKLDIIKEYASAYSTIMNKKSFRYYYIDGFAGAGVHVSKSTGEFVPGSPTNAFNVKPPFSGYHFIDLDGDKVDLLKEITSGSPNVDVYEGDCNRILLDKVLPAIQYKEYKRALCVLDPYGLHLDWDIISMAGQSKAIEVFLNFPLMDMNMNVLWNNPEKVEEDQIARMNIFWGDDTWRQVAYRKTPGLFDTIEEKTSNEAVAEAFRERLNKIAGFAYVPQPIPMRNTKGGIVYYLFFASPNKTGSKIVQHIFNKYKDR